MRKNFYSKQTSLSVLSSIHLGIMLFLIPLATYADITSSAKDGFTIQQTITMKAPPIMVYRSLVRDIGKWWNSEHTFSGNSANLYIEDKAQGCFCEKLDEKPAIQHMNIIYAAPGELLRMQGGLGPLQSMAVTGSMSWTFVKKGKGVTEIRLNYNVGGYTPEGLDKLASAVDGVLHQQLQRLKDFTERKIRIQSKQE